MQDNYTCKPFKKAPNFKFTLADNFNAIPENLLVNVVVFLLLMFMFSKLRSKACAVYCSASKRPPSKWIQIFYGEVMYMNFEDSDGSIAVSPKTQSCFSWICYLFRLKDDEISKKCGLDSIHYLSFHRHLISCIAILTVFGISVVLPVNFTGTLYISDNSFAKTTFINLEPDSPLLGVHVFESFLFLVVVVLTMGHFVRNQMVKQFSIPTTLLVKGIPKSLRNTKDLKEHFETVYPSCVVSEITFAFDVKQLTEFETKYKIAHRAKLWCENDFAEKSERPKVRPYFCGRISCFGFKQVDAIEYFETEETKLKKLVEAEAIACKKYPLGIAFLKFENEEMVQTISNDFNKICGESKMQITDSKFFKTGNWEVEHAPIPTDIIWENLSFSKGNQFLYYFFAMMIIFFVVFIFTTPFVALEAFNGLLNPIQNTLLAEFAPSIVLWTFATILPLVVESSIYLIPFHTNSRFNSDVMKYSFAFLMLMILVLPSLGLTSLKAALDKEANDVIQWQCIFMADNGALFINYIITTGFIGVAMQFIRLGELIKYLISICISRSEAEQEVIRTSQLNYFPFGTQYARHLLIFAIVVTFGLSCPLILPFGLVTLILLYYVDKYNIYFAYNRSSVNENIHESAVFFVYISLFIKQLYLFLLFLFRSKDISKWAPLTTCTLVILVLIIIFCLLHWVPWVLDYVVRAVLSPSRYREVSQKIHWNKGSSIFSDTTASSVTRSTSDFNIFLPKVLQKQNNLTSCSNSQNV